VHTDARHRARSETAAINEDVITVHEKPAPALNAIDTAPVLTTGSVVVATLVVVPTVVVVGAEVVVVATLVVVPASEEVVVSGPGGVVKVTLTRWASVTESLTSVAVYVTTPSRRDVSEKEATPAESVTERFEPTATVLPGTGYPLASRRVTVIVTCLPASTFTAPDTCTLDIPADPTSTGEGAEATERSPVPAELVAVTLKR
jgi:hypothetical protein